MKNDDIHTNTTNIITNNHQTNIMFLNQAFVPGARHCKQCIFLYSFILSACFLCQFLQKVYKYTNLSYKLDGVVQLLSNKISISLEIDTVADNFDKVEHRKINESMGNIIVGDDFVSKQNGVSIDLSLALTNSGDGKRGEDATLLCMRCVYPFTLFAKVTKTLDRCGNRLHITGSSVLRKKQESSNAKKIG